jgi:multiple sugar transport system permease protein
MKRKRLTDNLWGWGLIAPSFLLILILNLWPVIENIYYSLCKMKGFAKPVFIGFSNYVTALSDGEIGQAFLNTLLYTLMTVPVGIFLALVAACFLNTEIRGKGFFRTLYYIPVVSAPVAVAMVWKWMYNDEYGIINYALKGLGLQPINWIADGNVVLISLALIGIWSMVGYNIIILLSGLQGIPKTYYEAAEVDGAGSIRRFFVITVPLVTPTLFFVLITTCISSLQVFDNVYMIVSETNPAFPRAESIVYLFYRYMFNVSNKGYGATIGTLLLAVVLVFTYVQMKTQHKWVHYQ